MGKTARDLIRNRILLAFFCFLFSGCQFVTTSSAPSIVFSKIPPFDERGPDKLDMIEGRVANAQPDQQIVLYARSGALHLGTEVELSVPSHIAFPPASSTRRLKWLPPWLWPNKLPSQRKKGDQ